eukprot:CAMPEP_0175122092 /NCGR_PEP_ID=MMETSP0087-20121206/1530_1 /TAXON_ID=136419 /ORGANISM="Unknown Unknown, Strain D1" /LENGTH=308 /DNA_ID=CAMNT_0016403703 /DNA_START=38 /DNA_END=960 /DNA_ORIENTATION=-
MYIGPWQEYKLGKLISAQTALLKQALQSQQERFEQASAEEFARAEYARLKLPPVSGLVPGGIQRISSRASVGSTRSAPEHGGTPKEFEDHRPNSTRWRNNAGTPGARRAPLSRWPAGQGGLRRRKKGPPTKKEIARMHQQRLSTMRNLYGINQDGTPVTASNAEATSRAGDFHIAPSPHLASMSGDTHGFQSLHDIQMSPALQGGRDVYSRLRLAIEDPASKGSPSNSSARNSQRIHRVSPLAANQRSKIGEDVPYFSPLAAGVGGMEGISELSPSSGLRQVRGAPQPEQDNETGQPDSSCAVSKATA